MLCAQLLQLQQQRQPPTWPQRQLHTFEKQRAVAPRDEELGLVQEHHLAWLHLELGQRDRLADAGDSEQGRHGVASGLERQVVAPVPIAVAAYVGHGGPQELRNAVAAVVAGEQELR